MTTSTPAGSTPPDPTPGPQTSGARPIRRPLPTTFHGRLLASARRQWPQLVVLLGVAVGLLVVASHHFRRGTFLIGCCVLLHAVLRAVLPQRRAGWLVIRSRVVDIATSGAFALALLWLTLTVPAPR